MQLKSGDIILDLLVTTMGNLPEDVPHGYSCLDDHIIVHLVATKIRKIEKDSIEVEITANIVSHHYYNYFCEFSDTIPLTLSTADDLRKAVHRSVDCENEYMKNIIRRAKIESINSNTNLTTYCKGFKYVDYIWLQKYLINFQEGVFNRVKDMPRTSGDEKFRDEFQNMAISLFLKRIGAICNNAFYLRSDEYFDFTRRRDKSMENSLR